MATTPSFVFLRFREELSESYGAVLDQLVGQINYNFQNPSRMSLLGSAGLDAVPEPVQGELQQLIAGINRGFTNISASRLSSPVSLRAREQLPEPLGSELEGVVAAVNLGLRNLFP